MRSSGVGWAGYSLVARTEDFLAAAFYTVPAELENTPDLYGTIIFNFIIEYTGRVSKVFVEKSTLNIKPLEECLLDCFSNLVFPVIDEEKGITTVTYPIIFSSGK